MRGIGIRHLLRVAAILVAACLGLLSVGFSSHAESEVRWTEPVDLSAKYGHLGWFPEVHGDHFGHVHVTWQGEVPGGEGENALYYAFWDGVEWSDVNDLVIAPPTAWTIRSALASDRAGGLHLIYRQRATIYYEQAPIDLAWSAGEWTGRRQFSATDSGYLCDMVCDGSGVLHAIWTEVTGCDGDCGEVFYRRSTDRGRTWSYPQIISEGLAYDAAAQLECDQGNRVYAIWDTVAEDGSRLAVTMRASFDSGETWQQPVSIGSVDDRTYQGAVGIGRQGQVVVVWHPVEGDGIQYKVSGDGGVTWSDAARVPGVIARPENTPPYDRYDVATDSTGMIHLLAVGSPASGEEPTSVYHCRWDGVTWLEPAVVYDGPGFPEFPAVTLSNGNELHAVWFTREKLWGQSKWEVWHSRAEIGAPPATPVPLPTVSPTKAATVAPTSTPTLTPTPLADPTIRPVNWRQNANLPLLVAFLAMVVLSVSVIVFRRVRGR